MTLQSRMTKVNQIAQSARELPGSYKKSRFYRMDSVRTGKPYQAGWRYSKEDGIVTLNTWLYSFHISEHPANTCQTIAYQVLGAIKAQAASEGKTVSFCDSFDKAVRLLNFDGQLIKIRNKGQGIVWGVVR